MITSRLLKRSLPILINHQTRITCCGIMISWRNFSETSHDTASRDLIEWHNENMNRDDKNDCNHRPTRRGKSEILQVSRDTIYMSVKRRICERTEPITVHCLCLRNLPYKGDYNRQHYLCVSGRASSLKIHHHLDFVGRLFWADYSNPILLEHGLGLVGLLSFFDS